MGGKLGQKRGQKRLKGENFNISPLNFFSQILLKTGEMLKMFKLCFQKCAQNRGNVEDVEDV